MDAEDVKFSLDRARAEDSVNAQKALFAGITDVTVVDPLTVQVTLGEANGSFLFNMAWGDAVIVAPESIENIKTNPVGTGAFKFVEWVQGDRIDLARNAEPSGPAEPYFCHTVCEIGSEPMQPTMDRLNDWMDANPREVVVLFIQDTVTPQDTDAVLRKAGLADKAYVHPTGAQWPTLRQMIDSNKRLVVLMENTGGGTEYPYLHQGFDLVQDTEYTFKTADDFTCTLKRGSADSPLFSVNHWLASFTKLISSAEEVNAYDVLKPRIDECEIERGRKPSMIAVNWYDRGDLFRVVDELNQVG